MPLWPKGDPGDETSEQWFKALSKLQPQINILSLLSDWLLNQVFQYSYKFL